MTVNITQKLRNCKPCVFLVNLSKKIILPGFDKLPFFEVASFFIKGIQRGAIITRATSLSFIFFLALFPTIIFFFTLIPYIPIENFQDTLLGLLKDIFPQGLYETLNTTLEDTVKHQRGGLLSFGFVLGIYFATLGMNRIMEAFNHTYHVVETRPFIKQFYISLLLIVILSFIIFMAISLLIFGTFSLKFLVAEGILRTKFIYYVMQFVRWLVIISMFFFVISFIYYLAPAKRTEYRFFSAGSTLATLLFVLTGIGFNLYLINFIKFNKLYGSIGTLMLILVWIFFNSIILLIGFELNASIHHAKIQRQEKEQSKQA